MKWLLTAWVIAVIILHQDNWNGSNSDLVFGVKVALSDTTGLLRPGLPATVELGRAASP